MTGNDLARTSLLEAQSTNCYEESNASRKELERWASAIAGCLQQSAPVQPHVIGLGGAESEARVPEGWRPSVEVLTPSGANLPGGSAVALPASASTSQPTEESQRLQVRVKTEELGEVAVVVERLEAGLRVLVGASDPKAIALLKRDAQAVMETLQTDGQAIKSLEIVRMNGFGTDLALSKVASGQRARRSQESADSDLHAGQRKKRTKRLDVTG